MSLRDEREFYDVTPHRIRVTSIANDNDYGEQVTDPSTARVYRCYVSENANITQDLRGTEVTYPLSVNVLATPVDEGGNPVGSPMRVMDSDEVVFLTPDDIPDRHLASVACYYDADGTLNNMVLGFS